MIDHISVAVRDLVIAERFYTAVLAPLGFSRLGICPTPPSASARSIRNFGSTNARLWGGSPTVAGCTSACARPMCHKSTPFTQTALKAGGTSDGDPGVRMHYDEGYYAALSAIPRATP